MKKALSVALAAALAAAITLCAAGCKKSAGSSTKPSAKTDSSLSSKVESTTASSTQASSPQQSASVAPTTQAANGSANDAVKNIALSYYGASEANGDTVTVTGSETGSDGKLYYFVNVNSGGATYPLVISEDATIVLTPEQYSAGYSNSVNSAPAYDGGDNDGDGNDNTVDYGNYGDNSDGQSNDPIYPYGGYGPDGAEP